MKTLHLKDYKMPAEFLNTPARVEALLRQKRSHAEIEESLMDRYRGYVRIVIAGVAAKLADQQRGVSLFVKPEEVD